MTGSEYKDIAEGLWGPSWKTNAAAWHGVSIRTIERWSVSLEPLPPDTERSIRWVAEQKDR